MSAFGSSDRSSDSDIASNGFRIRRVRQGSGRRKGKEPEGDGFIQTRLVPLDPPRPPLKVLGLQRQVHHDSASEASSQRVAGFMNDLDLGSDSTGMIRFQNNDLESPAPNVCVGCFYMSKRRRVPVEPSIFDEFVKLISDNAGQVDPHVHASMVFEYYNTNLYEPYKDREQPFPSWSFDQVMVHLTMHILDPNVTMANNIADIKHIIKNVKDNMFIENTTTGIKVPNLDAIKAYEKLVKLELLIYRTKTSEMNFQANLEPAITQGTRYTNFK